MSNGYDEDPLKNTLSVNERDRLKRQWKNTDGPGGVTDAYREGWDRIFGRKCALCGTPTATKTIIVTRTPDASPQWAEEWCLKCFSGETK